MKKTIHSPFSKRRVPVMQAGFTLVELMVAMAVGLLVVLAALAALLVARSGFSNVDAASQLRDNGRFVSLLINRLAVQSGFKDFNAVAGLSNPDLSPPAPAITGFSNAKARTDELERATPFRPTEPGYGSDVLIMRFQPAKLYPTLSAEDDSSRRLWKLTDQAMIDCFGYAPKDIDGNTNQGVFFSAFSVGVDATGEPTLMCTRSENGLAPYSTSSLVRGVEVFKVLYGVDSGVNPNAEPDPAAPLDKVAKRYLTADQMIVPGNKDATEENWRRVRSLRIGMVLRSDVTPGERERLTFHPFGPAKSSAAGAVGSAFASTENINSTFNAPADGRIRQVVTFTVHLRNDQKG